MSNPKISVITVCFNAVHTIEKTLQSVIHQTYDPIELIIVDGGSTDGTIDVIKKYEEKISLWKSEPDDGVYDAMNKAVKMAGGDWLFFLNSDDVFYDPEVLNRVAPLLQHPNTIYYGDVIKLPTNERYSGRFSRYKLSGQNICHQSIFYPKIVFDIYQYDTRYKIYADWDLNIKCMGNPNLRFEYINQVIAYFNIEGLSSSRDDHGFKKGFYKNIRRNLGLKYSLYSWIVRRLSMYKSRIMRSNSVIEW